MMAWFARIYAVCLRLYPADYQREYGPLMLQAARDLCRNTPGWGGLIWLWTRILADTVTTAIAVHRDQYQQETGRMTNVTFGQLTDTGVLRPINEDSVLSRFYPRPSSEEQLGLFIVADGLGGHPDGNKASKLAVKVISDYVADQIAAANQAPLDVLVAAVQAANSAVLTNHPHSGAAVTAVILRDSTAYIAQAGDTRAYLVTADDLQQLTTDHSIVQRMIELGRLDPDDPVKEKMQNVLYRSLGQEDGLEIDTFTYPLPSAARLLLCSDGLWNMVEAPRILDIVNGEDNPQEACDKLIALANHRGGKDNITAIVVNIAKRGSLTSGRTM
jgi:protein phosphatase